MLDNKLWGIMADVAAEQENAVAKMTYLRCF